MGIEIPSMISFCRFSSLLSTLLAFFSSLSAFVGSASTLLSQTAITEMVRSYDTVLKKIPSKIRTCCLFIFSFGAIVKTTKDLHLIRESVGSSLSLG